VSQIPGAYPLAAGITLLATGVVIGLPGGLLGRREIGVLIPQWLPGLLLDTALGLILGRFAHGTARGSNRVPVMPLRYGFALLPLRYCDPHPDAGVKLGLGRSGRIVFI